MFFIKKTELFQGEKYLKISKNYFEGWYFKNTNNTRPKTINIPPIMSEENDFCTLFLVFLLFEEDFLFLPIFYTNLTRY